MANIKRISLQLMTVAAISFAGVEVAQSQIPVTDGTHIATSVANQVESITKWVTQFNQLKTQITQYKQQYESITGNRNMGALFDNPLLKSALPPEWQNLVKQVKSSASYIQNRKQYPTVKGMPKTNEMYDVIATQNTVMEDLYKKSNDRITQIQSLMSKIDTAKDPAAKMDLTNRLISEQNAVQANQNLVTILQSKQKQELDAAGVAARKEYACKEFGRTTCA